MSVDVNNLTLPLHYITQVQPDLTNYTHNSCLTGATCNPSWLEYIYYQSIRQVAIRTPNVFVSTSTELDSLARFVRHIDIATAVTAGTALGLPLLEQDMMEEDQGLAGDAVAQPLQFSPAKEAPALGSSAQETGRGGGDEGDFPEQND